MEHSLEAAIRRTTDYVLQNVRRALEAEGFTEEQIAGVFARLAIETERRSILADLTLAPYGCRV